MSVRRFCRAVIAALALTGLVAIDSTTAAAQTPTVLRGSNSAEGFFGTSSAPLVLRGTTPPPAPAEPAPAAAAPCPDGYVLDANSGCVGAGFASAPYDDDWLLGYPLIEPPRRFGRRFTARRAHPFRQTTAAARRFIGVAHPDSFGRR